MLLILENDFSLNYIGEKPLKLSLYHFIKCEF